MSVKASDLRAVVHEYEIGGEPMKMRFDNYTYCVCEEVYETQFHKDVSFTQILSELGKNKQRALVTCVYAALISAGSRMSFREFCEKVTFGDLVKVGGAMMTDIVKSMPENDAKNA